MSRRSGHNGRIYMALTSAGTPEPLPFQAKWSIGVGNNPQDVSSMGDNNSVFVGSMPDPSGDFTGFWDDSTYQTYKAAMDGQARKFYLYPDLANAPTNYWYGTWIADFKANGGLGTAVAVSASWKPAGDIRSSVA